jgi:hypothetical protein
MHSMEMIACYTREQAIEDGELFDVTTWAEKGGPDGMLAGFPPGMSVCMTASLWATVDVDGPEPWKVRARQLAQDTRGRAHDVLWMAYLAWAKRGHPADDIIPFEVLMVVADARGYLPARHTRLLSLWLVVNAEGATVMFPEDY